MGLGSAGPQPAGPPLRVRLSHLENGWPRCQVSDHLQKASSRHRPMGSGLLTSSEQPTPPSRCRPGCLSCMALREPGFSSVVSRPRLPAALTASSQRLATPSNLLHLPWLEPPQPVQGLKGGASLASRVSRPEESQVCLGVVTCVAVAHVDSLKLPLPDSLRGDSSGQCPVSHSLLGQVAGGCVPHSTVPIRLPQTHALNSPSLPPSHFTHTVHTHTSHRHFTHKLSHIHCTHSHTCTLCTYAHTHSPPPLKEGGPNPPAPGRACLCRAGGCLDRGSTGRPGPAFLKRPKCWG